MPLILDANQMSNCLNKTPESIPIIIALSSRKVTIVFGGTKILAEYSRNHLFLALVNELFKAGVARKLDDNLVNQQERVFIQTGAILSDDPHILAVAFVGKSRLLFTEDQALMHDFKSKSMLDKPRGRIYNLADSAKLLKRLGR